MFERRLKNLGYILAAFVVLLALRLVQVQVLARGYYVDLAEKAMTRSRLIETTRGTIYDVRGRVLAEDAACIDAAVDYRAVTHDRDSRLVRAWVTQLATDRLRRRLGDAYLKAPAARRKQLREQEEQTVRDAIASMWPKLAALSGMSIEQVEEIRTSIDLKVRMRQRRIVYRKYEAAIAQAANRPKPPWYQRWLVSGGEELPTEDEFEETIAEQTSPHVVLSAIPQWLQNELGKNADEYPGLELLPSVHRVYPFGHVGAHAIGHLRQVKREHLENDPDSGDELRAYQPNDPVGDAGIEALAERRLRGVRGQESYSGHSSARESPGQSSRVDPIPGESVTSTLDIELQSQIRDAFFSARIPHPDRERREWVQGVVHGAAIVIDVPTGEVRALVSYPDYDLNTVGRLYAQLASDVRNRPLFNRATLSQFEPGSTVKPVVGIAAVAANIAGLDERIECTGYLVLRGRRWERGRCWTATISDSMVYPHHCIPAEDPHRGPTPDLDGHLDLTEAIQRSCNIYFENMADRLGAEGLSVWFERFGIGRPTGIGIAESSGRLPRQYRGPAALHATWTAGIGQGSVLATPLQIACAMSTIAREGVWLRPKLLRESERLTPWGSIDQPDRADLHLPPAAVRAAQRGMVLVVNSRAGTGESVRRGDVTVAAKTGTAQAEFFKLPMLDESGNPVLDKNGNRVWVRQRASTWNNPNPDLPWYRASDLSGERVHHSWVVGFAPAENPTIAFAVMIEYGGAGGNAVAGPVASALLDACVNHGYVPTRAASALRGAR